MALATESTLASKGTWWSFSVCAGDKRTQARDIEVAQARWHDYLTEVNMSTTTARYADGLRQALLDPAEAAAYLDVPWRRVTWTGFFWRSATWPRHGA